MEVDRFSGPTGNLCDEPARVVLKPEAQQMKGEGKQLYRCEDNRCVASAEGANGSDRASCEALCGVVW